MFKVWGKYSKGLKSDFEENTQPEIDLHNFTRISFFTLNGCIGIVEYFQNKTLKNPMDGAYL